MTERLAALPFKIKSMSGVVVSGDFCCGSSGLETRFREDYCVFFFVDSGQYTKFVTKTKWRVTRILFQRLRQNFAGDIFKITTKISLKFSFSRHTQKEMKTLLFCFFTLVVLVSGGPTQPDLTSVIVAGSGLESATSSIEASFVITAKDEAGAARTSGGDTFLLELKGARSITGIITDRLDGTYSAKYTPTKSGGYTAEVKLLRSKREASFQMIHFPVTCSPFRWRPCWRLLRKHVVLLHADPDEDRSSNQLRLGCWGDHSDRDRLHQHQMDGKTEASVF